MQTYLKYSKCGSILMWGTTTCPKCGSKDIIIIGGSPGGMKVTSILASSDGKLAQAVGPSKAEKVERGKTTTVVQEALKERLEKSKKQGAQATKDFFEELRNVKNDDEAVEFLLSVLEETKATDNALLL